MRILPVDDHPAMRCGVKYLLEAAGVWRWSGRRRPRWRSSGSPGRCGPGRRFGIEACREIKGRPNAPLVMLFTAYTDAENVAAAVLAGADGYLHKGVEGENLIEALQRVEDGEKVWLFTTADTEVRKRVERVAGGARLTSKEKEALSLMLRRYTIAEISAELYISLYTAKNDVSSILRKLGRMSHRDLV